MFPAGRIGSLPVCRIYNLALGTGHTASHQRLAADLQVCCYHRSQQRCSSRQATAAVRAQSQGCMMPAPSAAAGGLLPSIRNSTCPLRTCMPARPDHCRAAAACCHVSRLAVFSSAAAGYTSVHCAAATSPSAEAVSISVSSNSHADAVDTDHDRSSTLTSSSTVLPDAQANDELGHYSYRMIISYDGTEYSGWQVGLAE